MGLREYNVLLELIKQAEEYIFYIFPEIKEEVESMAANILNLQSIKMWDEAEQQKREAVKQTAKQAAKQASLSTIEMVKKFGFTLTEEQIQEILKHTMEQQEFEE